MSDHEDRLSQLEAAVSRLKDCEAIRQLLARYGPLADSADTPHRRTKAGSLFSQHGVYDLGKDWSAVGPEAIGELLNNPAHLELVANGSAHVMGLPYIVLDGDTATALSYSRVYRHENGEFKIWRVSANEWHCARIKNVWKVERRINRLLDGSEAAREILKRVDLEE
ncbi:MAG: hypothetical protein ACI9JM_002826 [Halioglobus sp.]|jgi:hypothetical protein